MTDNYREEMRETFVAWLDGRYDSEAFLWGCRFDKGEREGSQAGYSNLATGFYAGYRAALSRLSTQGDEYHTMDDLYAHRFALTAALVKRLPPESSCKSRKNGDGSVWDGLFVVYINTPQGQVSYHYKIELWDKMPCREVETPPPYDGHTPESTLDRLMSIEAFSAQDEPKE